MHSGNIGHAQDLDSLIRAATFLRDLDHLRIVLIGGGARREELKELARRWYPAEVAAMPPKNDSHRALDDIRESIAELRWYREHVFTRPAAAAAVSE